MTLPPIVSMTDRERLVSIARSAMMTERAAPIASNLLSEMSCATVLATDAVPQNVVMMGSEVEVHDDIRHSCSRVRLVYPDDAPLYSGAVSVLTPLGVALIGLSEGDSIQWRAATGDQSRITILRVFPRE